ncbi:MAG TPA: hypothetical protein PLZ12_15390 [Saprospiraceae bacterium]|nr:hypothetical protein [Saprospiraceae bacterium]
MQRFLFSLCMVCGMFVIGTAQTLPYTFSTATAVYEPLENAISLNNGELWDDPDFVVPIGFEFDLFGQSINELSFDYGLGGIVGAVDNGENFISLLIPYGSDIADRGQLTGESKSEIRYLTEGAPGSRIFKLEWSNAGFYYEMDENETNDDFVNFQMWLYEGSNIIEFRYGESSIADPDLVHEFAGSPLVALVDTIIADGSDVASLFYLKGDPDSPSVFTTNSILDLFFLNSILDDSPADGQIYRFAPNVSSLFGPSLVASEVQAWPTVATEKVTLYWPEWETTQARAQARIIDAQGRAFGSPTAIAGAVTEISVAHLPAGAYWVQLLLPGGGLAGSKKIIKQ